MTRILAALAIAIAIAATISGFAGTASADVCDGPGLPPCAAPPDPAQECAVIAFRTFTPCNWYGIKVPQGTPGSWG
jgi:hypothetical protein